MSMIRRRIRRKYSGQIQLHLIYDKVKIHALLKRFGFGKLNPKIAYFVLRKFAEPGKAGNDVTDLGVFVMRSHNWINASKLSQDQPKFI